VAVQGWVPIGPVALVAPIAGLTACGAAQGPRRELQPVRAALDVALLAQFPFDAPQLGDILHRRPAEGAFDELLVHVVEARAGVVLAEQLVELVEVGQLGQGARRVGVPEALLAVPGHRGVVAQVLERFRMPALGPVPPALVLTIASAFALLLIVIRWATLPDVPTYLDADVKSGARAGLFLGLFAVLALTAFTALRHVSGAGQTPPASPPGYPYGPPQPGWPQGQQPGVPLPGAWQQPPQGGWQQGQPQSQAPGGWQQGQPQGGDPQSGWQQYPPQQGQQQGGWQQYPPQQYPPQNP